MELTAGDLIDLSGAVEVLAVRQFGSVRTSYRFSRLRDRLIQEMRPILATKEQIQKLHMVTKDGQKFDAIVGHEEDIRREWEELRGTKVDVELHRMSLADFEKMPDPPEPWILSLLERCGCLEIVQTGYPL
jgi:hypothetical protein